MIKHKIENDQKRNENNFSSLRVKLFGALVFGVALAVFILIFVSVVATRYISTVYMSEQSRIERENAYIEELQKYVIDNNLTVDDSAKIADWAQNYKYLYVLIYKDDKLLFESGQYDNNDDGKMEENKDNDVQKPEDSVENGENNGLDGEDTDSETTPDNTEPPPDDEGADGSTDDDVSSDSTGDNEDSLDNVGDGEDSSENTGDGEDSSLDADGTDGSPDNTDTTDKEEENPSDKDTVTNDSYTPGITVRPPSREELIANAQKNGSHAIYTVDDGVLLASMVDYTEYLYYDIANIVSCALAILAFLAAMWMHYYGITKRISRLGKEVTLVADVDMEHPIFIQGDDEITRLSMDIEKMRTSMLENVQKQFNALESNKDLITSMSHDIRTPLTVLLGYLEIMKFNAPEGEMKNYIEASERTALRLKKMSDDMFSYFLVYGGDIEIDIQECDARTLIEQMISVHVFLLREQGYVMEYNFEDEDNDFLDDVIMVTDPPQLMRIIENIFSNVLKYADAAKPIKVEISAEIDEMTIKVSNSVSDNPDEAQKNGVGLRSCRKLANAMDIRFSTEEEDGIFTSVMNIPIVPHIEYSDDEAQEEKGEFGEWLDSALKKSKEALLNLCAKIKQFFLKAVQLVKRIFKNMTKK